MIFNMTLSEQGSLAELTNIRIGADGTNYPTAGDAVRGQVTDLKEDLDNFFEPSWTAGYFVDYTDGAVYGGGVSGYSYCDYLNVCEGEVIEIKTTTGNDTAGFAFYDKEKQYLSGTKPYTGGDVTTVTKATVPAGARYLRISCFTTYKSSFYAKMTDLAESLFNIGENRVTVSNINNTGVDVSDDLNKLFAIGGLIVLRAGTYGITKTIKIPSNTKVIGYGATIQLLDDGTHLDSHVWDNTRDEPTIANLPNYRPYVYMNNVSNVEVEGLKVTGSENYSTDLHVGICAESSNHILIKKCESSRCNYHPEDAPPRPSGQYRTGWNFAVLRSYNVEIGDCKSHYGAYECIRIGNDSNNIYVHDCDVAYGWRTGIQVIWGCNNVLVEHNNVFQNDFDEYDTCACMTLHTIPQDDAKTYNITFRNNKLTGKLYANGDSSAISFIGYHGENIKIENNYINITGAPDAIHFWGDGFICGNKISSVNKGITIVFSSDSKVSVINNDINSVDLAVYIAGTRQANASVSVLDNNIVSAGHAIYEYGGASYIVINGNKAKLASGKSLVIITSSTTPTHLVVSNNMLIAGAYGVNAISNVEHAIITSNDFQNATTKKVNDAYISESANIIANNA